MNLSTYRRVFVAGWIIVSALLSLLLALISPGLGLLAAIVFALTGLATYPIQFGLLEARLRDHGGRFPMPGVGLGLWGVDIIDDREPAGGTARAERAVCPNCRAVQALTSGRYCHECGAALRRPPTTTRLEPSPNP